MYYFIDKKETIEKYSVSFSKEELEKLKIEIINNCSEIEHHEYEGTHGPNEFDYFRIRNYKERFVRVKESRDSLQWPDQRIYHYSYDEYKFPELVSAIEELLNRNVLVLDTIFNTNPESKIETIDERIRKASAELDAIDNLKITKKREKLDELQKLIELKKLNKKQKSVVPYYARLRELITLDLVDTITKEEIERVNQFFGNSTNVKKQSQKIQTLKK
ncbi:MAG: hypothetical protein IJD92_05360 [Bacilli bacterium]|nr:hypothetical protein [Bacilli bacterium]